MVVVVCKARQLVVQAVFIGNTCSATWEIFRPLVHISLCCIFSVLLIFFWEYYILWPHKTNDSMFLNNSAIQRWRWLHCNSTSFTEHNSYPVTCLEIQSTRDAHKSNVSQITRTLQETCPYSLNSCITKGLTIKFYSKTPI